MKSIMRSKIHKKRLTGSRLAPSSHGFGHHVGSTRVPLYFKSYVMSGPEKIRSRVLWRYIVS